MLVFEEKTLSSSPGSFPLGTSERGMPQLPEFTIRLQNLTLREQVHKTEGLLDNWRHQGGAHPLSQGFKASRPARATRGAHAQHRNNNSKNKRLGVLMVAENTN